MDHRQFWISDCKQVLAFRELSGAVCGAGFKTWLWKHESKRRANIII